MRIVIIDDNEDLREMLSDVIQTEYENVNVATFSNPRDFLFQSIGEVDLVICDYCFGHTTVEFFWEKLKNYKIVIYSGSVESSNLDCALISKTNIRGLLKFIHRLKTA